VLDGVPGVLARPPQLSSLFLFRRSEENQYFQLFKNVVEAMFHSSLDENNLRGSHLGVLRTDLHASPTADDIVHLIFTMRLLRIVTTGRQNVNARAHGRDSKEFEVEFIFSCALASKIVDMEEVNHAASEN
jgi:hypothetical protein